jgi:hypothetical protein
VSLLEESGVPVGRGVAVATPLLSQSQPEFGGFNIQLGDLTATCVDMLLAKLARNERGIPSMRQTLLIQAPWVDGPAAFTPVAPKRPEPGARRRRLAENGKRA